MATELRPAAPGLQDLHARITARDETALRYLVRAFSAPLIATADRVIGERRARGEPASRAAAVVEAVMLRLWTRPSDWTPGALDLLLFRSVRDVARDVRTRRITPARAAEEWRAPDMRGAFPANGLLAALDADAFRQALRELTPAQRETLDRGWYDANESREANELLAALWDAARPPGGGEPAPQVRRLAASVALAAVDAERAGAEAQPGLEHNVVSRARRDGSVRAARPLRDPFRGRERLKLAAAALIAGAVIAAIATSIAYVATRGPVDGEALPLNDDGTVGVIIPRWESRPAALVFWGLPAPEPPLAWQLWSVRASGALVAGPLIQPNRTGRAAVPLDLDPRTLEDPIVGYALTLDDPSAREDSAPPRSAVRHQFALD